MSFDLKIQDGDLSIGTDGDLKLVEKKDKLVQDLLKISTTTKGSKQKYPFYGSLISNSLIGSVLPEDFTNTYASSQLRESVQSLVEMQAIQEKYQYLSPEESIGAIREVSIQKFTSDPRYFLIYISVLNKAFTKVEAQFEFSTTGL